MLVLSVFLFTIGTVHADELSVSSKLTSEQKAKLQLEAAQMENAESTTTVSTAKQWVDIGTAIGSGLASTAKELGVAANDFANTPVGKISMLLIVWHFFGSEAVHILFGAFWLLIMLPTWLWVYRRTWFITTITTYESGKGPDGKKKVVEKSTVSDSDVGDGTQFALWAFLVIGLAVGVISIFSF